MVNNESPDEYKRRIASDILNAQVNQPPNPSQLDNQPDENLVALDIDDEEEGEEEEDQPQINQDQIENITRPQKPAQAATPEQQIREAREAVPEYVETPAAAEEPQPGGPAVQQNKKERTREQLEKEASRVRSKIIKGERQQLAERAVGLTWQDLKKKITTEALKKLAVQAWEWVATATAEYWVPILLGIIGIIIIIVAVVFLVRALQTPNTMGSSPVQAADILNDRPWISKVLGLSGDKNVADKLTSLVLDGLSQDLNKLESEMNNPPGYPPGLQQKVVAKIQEIRGYISEFQQLTPGDKQANDVGLKIVTAVGQLSDFFGQAPWRIDVQTAWPLPKDKIRSFNNSLHCGTPLRPENCNHHRTFEQFMKGTADATDIGAPYNTLVFAIFAGTVVKRGNVLGTYLEIKSADGHFLAVYAHMRAVPSNLVSGTTVQIGNQIGQLTGLQNGISNPHLHFELYKDGQAVVTTREDIASHKYAQVGHYLWDRDKAALNLN